MSVFLFQTHAFLLRMIYRVIAPRHPRGWLEVHAVHGDQGPGGPLWIHCHGMERWGLPNLEIVDVPPDLGGYAHGLMFDFTGYIKNVKPVKTNEHISGCMVSENQRAIHQATFRESLTDDAHGRGTLRIVDFSEPREARFPHRLFAAHLIALSDQSKNRGAREKMLRRAVEIYPGSFAEEDMVADFDPGQNYGNFIGWESLADVLMDGGQVEEGLACLDQAVARCPQWAREFQAHVKKEIVDNHLPADSNPRFRYWNTMDVAAAVKRARAGASGAGYEDED